VCVTRDGSPPPAGLKKISVDAISQGHRRRLSSGYNGQVHWSISGGSGRSHTGPNHGSDRLQKEGLTLGQRGSDALGSWNQGGPV
jgi:hypothetical protein